MLVAFLNDNTSPVDQKNKRFYRLATSK